MTHTAETIDTLFQGKLRFYQARSGYRFSLDALLLAYFATVKAHDEVADLGTGSGVLPVVIAYREPGASIVGIEVQPQLVLRARRNVEINRMRDRIRIVQGDVREVERMAAAASFNAVVCNPPYRAPASGRISPDPERKIARHEILGAMRHFLAAGSYLLPARGRMSLVYPAARAVDLLESMRSARLEPKRLKMVHSFADAQASLMLIEGVKEGRSGVSVLPPLVIYGAPGVYTVEIQRLLDGAAALPD